MLSAAEIKHLRSLRDDDRARRDAGAFLVEGEKAVREFLLNHRFAVTLYATSEWNAAPAHGQTVHAVTPAEMEKISHLPSPSSVLAVVQRPAPAPLEPAHLRQGLTLALDTVQDPGNVGTIVRIADWYGIARILLGEGCSDPFSQKVVNASKGSLARVEIHRVDLPAVLAAAGVPVLGCDLDGASIHTFATPPAAVVVIGNEGRGLSPAVKAYVTQRITIPSFGHAESLNAAVAAAIVCDNLRRSADAT
jgi:TrmH family RNA methyltransferase